jgi:glutathionylspermidine synthase
MVDIKDFHHDVLNTSKPWFVTENFIHPDYIYCLAPWEEMIVNGYDHFKDFRKWIHSQKFLEPAWRWFMSHKGFMVYLTYLLENDESFSKYKSLPPEEKLKYVRGILCFYCNTALKVFERTKDGERNRRTDADEKLSLLHQWGKQSGAGSGLLQIHFKK